MTIACEDGGKKKRGNGRVVSRWFDRAAPTYEPTRDAGNETPVRIVESHDEAAQVFFSMAGRGYLPCPEKKGTVPDGEIAKPDPLRPVTLVHFDAHPDLLVPDSPPLPLGSTGDRAAVASCASIAEWILPLCHGGPLGRVVWLKPPWATQIPDGRHSVRIGGQRVCTTTVDGGGSDKSDGEDDDDDDDENDPNALVLGVSSDLEYYTDEMAVSVEELCDVHEVDLIVHTVWPQEEGASFAEWLDGWDDAAAAAASEPQMHTEAKPADAVAPAAPIPTSGHIVLDICLDFFSTITPWRPSHMTKEEHALVRRAYFPEIADQGSITGTSTAKVRYVKLLNAALLAGPNALEDETVRDLARALESIGGLGARDPNQNPASDGGDEKCGTGARAGTAPASVVRPRGTGGADTAGAAAPVVGNPWLGTTADQFVACTSACVGLWRDRSLGEEAMRGLHSVVSRPGIVACPDDEDQVVDTADGKGEGADGSESNPSPGKKPNWAPRSFSLQDFTECAELSDLPHHPSTAATVEGLLRATESIVAECGDPAFVTIARSVDDGYTPPAQAKGLESAVLGILDRALPRKPKVKQR